VPPSRSLIAQRRGIQANLVDMNLTAVLIALAVFLAIILLKRSGQISPSEAQAHLRNGALVIDVRTPGEFNSGHLKNAINLPLDQIETTLPRRVQDKSQVLLLHCQSGMRSSAAKKKLKALGYVNAFNLGSYGRAAQIVEGT
jgi:phage shock protein E